MSTLSAIKSSLTKVTKTSFIKICTILKTCFSSRFPYQRQKLCLETNIACCVERKGVSPSCSLTSAAAALKGPAYVGCLPRSDAATPCASGGLFSRGGRGPRLGAGRCRHRSSSGLGGVIPGYTHTRTHGHEHTMTGEGRKLPTTPPPILTQSLRLLPQAAPPSRSPNSELTPLSPTHTQTPPLFGLLKDLSLFRFVFFR